ncbi:xanthine dehydrogenase family protein molybdopterin-binding subunit [Pseudobacteriovorax antillogorgiicola]|uniref:Isoquinoline 1-oxidoreductase/isoquinoline 1-oxidoreductase, beta subunit n=1 Tax=Pseudobacteriovorax antillogorgiicola TaxID=1513793 RepID=A0A1Y6BVQ0_9BACT|nr:molybdopterin cofactor-binding domain-containing protein [Pseudobacteriovorax antillogorgiicola]TCS52258.1 isoquinoline 1-oxidoreductase/isoquinoline 1-oxidoreductase beta subunit [Pseudobacteriovorax antillogorgiicola]SMF31027.1 isoquinoline 1-oxidoreductase/isoquinoline 1-oxidoreductase, beta subunit [Pseudobacteriovorax antillogorgiicola]
MMKLSRRQMISRGVQGSLILGIPLQLTSCASTGTTTSDDNGQLSMLYLQVTPDNEFILTFDKVEMGQGVITGQATMFGEEADISPEQFTFKPATADSRYADAGGVQMTAGSSSTYRRWDVLREAGARYRLAIVESASESWGVPTNQISTKEGIVQTTDGKKQEPYAAFNTALANRSLPSAARLKNPKDFRYIGRYSSSVDAREKSYGEAKFGIDMGPSNSKKAIVIRCPVHGGTLKEFDRKSIEGLPEVVNVLPVSGGLAIVCEHYYQTLKVRQSLKSDWIRWDIPKEFEYNSEELFALYRSQLDDDKLESEKGEILVDATYELPYLAHSPMEPQNCTAWKQGDQLTIWAATQSPTITRNVGAVICGLSRDDVTVHVAKYMGGAFGRRTSDSTIDACEIASQVDYPVMVIWSREDDTRYSALRPMAVTRMQAVLKQDKVKTWRYQTVSQSLLQDFIKESGVYALPGWIPTSLASGIGSLVAGTMDTFGAMPIAVTGAEQPYDIPYDTDSELIESPIPTHFWRSVGNSLNGFFVESFIDELAASSSQDPLAFRLKLLEKSPRARKTLETVADLARWSKSKPRANRALGLAYHYSYRTHCAQITDVSVEGTNIQVHKVWTVVDCGQVVNPHIVEAQVRSSVIYGLSAALRGEITFSNGRVQQENFDSYPLLRLNETPEVITKTIDSQEHPTGIGEPALPALAAAVCNGIYRATGRRIRRLPLTNSMSDSVATR